MLQNSKIELNLILNNTVHIYFKYIKYTDNVNYKVNYALLQKIVIKRHCLNVNVFVRVCVCVCVCASERERERERDR